MNPKVLELGLDSGALNSRENLIRGCYFYPMTKVIRNPSTHMPDFYILNPMHNYRLQVDI